MKKIQAEIEEQTFEFPKDETELIAATKGMLILIYSYPINITASVLDGKLQYEDSVGFVHTFDCYERLSFKDLQQFVQTSIELHNYQLATTILQFIFRMKKYIKSKKLVKIFEQQKQNVIKLSNGYLLKTEKFVGKSKMNLLLMFTFRVNLIAGKNCDIF